MNLIKKSITFLMAFGALAMIGCGNNGNGPQKLSYQQALEWIDKHCRGGFPREIDESKVSWDYSKNDSQGKVTPETWDVFKECNVDDITQFTLISEVGVPDDEAGEKVGKSTVESTSALGDWGEECWDVEFFKITFKEKDNLELVLDGDQLQVTQINNYRNVPTEIGTVKLTLTEKITIYLESNGFCNKMDCSYTADDLGAAVYEGGELILDTECTLGKLDFSFTVNVVLPE